MAAASPKREPYPWFDHSWIPTPETPALLFDIETDGLLDNVTKVHCICAMTYPDGVLHSFGPDRIAEGLSLLADTPLLVAHNGLCFDKPAIAKLYPGITLPRLFDTLTASRLIWTNLKDLDFDRLRADARRRKTSATAFPAKLCGKHSLEAWGYRLGECKGDYGTATENAWEQWSEEMQAYCEQDVAVLFKLYRHILDQRYSPEALAIEHDFQEIIFKQEQAGVPFDEKAALALYTELCARREELKARLRSVFPDKVEEEVFIPKVNNKARGYVKGVPFLKKRIIEFNPNSREMIAERLTQAYGWQPSEFTETGKPKVDGDVLASLDFPACKLLGEYLEITKIVGMLSEGKAGWLRLVDGTGRIHGRVIACGAVTGRCTHNSPNLAQIPAHGTYGSQCRSLFVAAPGMVQVGADASGLELRMLASFMARYDGGRYARVLLDGDIHSANQKAAGLESRDNAKTFIYAFLYGAGDQKLGSIVAPTASPARQAQIGKRLKSKFFTAIPAVKMLLDAVQAAVKERPFLYGVDKRKLHVRSGHSALNTLLQSAGAVLVKFATIVFHREAERRHGWKQGVDYTQVLHVHDECQLQCAADKAAVLGALFVEAIEIAGRHFGLRCPTTGEYKIGGNWAETH